MIPFTGTSRKVIVTCNGKNQNNACPWGEDLLGKGLWEVCGDGDFLYLYKGLHHTGCAHLSKLMEWHN